MKKLFIPILLFFIIFIPTNVLASTGTFKEGEYINNAYIKKLHNGSGTYKHMTFLKRASDGMVAYCLEPWSILDLNLTYTDVKNINDLDDDLLNKINLIAYYGYGYGNHTDPIWYSITQLLIWRTIDPDSQFYFTSTLNGNKSNNYDNHFIELEKLVNDHENDTLSFTNSNISTMINEQSSIGILSGSINNYQIINNDKVNYTIKENTITISSNTTGEKTLSFIKQDNILKEIPLIYKNNYSQNMSIVGSYKPKEFSIKVNVNSGQITIKKLDSKFGETPSGEAELYGAVFKVYNHNNSFYQEVTIPSNGIITLSNLPSDTYYIKELTPGKGYSLNEEEKKIIINNDNREQTIEFYNTVITKKITIKKYLEDGNNKIPEQGVYFDIYENGVKIIKTSTNKNGELGIKLPYGKYLFHQINTTNDYDKIEDFEVNVDDTDKVLYYELIDKLKVAKLIINKLDFDTNTLINTNDVTFKILEIETNKEYIINTINGVASLNNLKRGSYVIMEMIPNNGYTINNEKYFFDVNDDILNNDIDNRIIKINIYNKKINIPNTGLSNNIFSIVVGIILLLIPIGINIYDKKNINM